MRSRLSFSDVRGLVSNVADKKKISNEKIKQKRVLYPGSIFENVKTYKVYTDTEDKFYVYDLDENDQIVFKTLRKMHEIAREMSSAGNELSKEFCFFNGKVKRTANFTTLTANLYYPMLGMQLPLVKTLPTLSYFEDYLIVRIVRLIKLMKNLCRLDGWRIWRRRTLLV